MPSVPVIALAALFLGIGAPCLAHDAPAGTASATTLDPGLGPLHHPVSTRNAEVQAYFDQGMKLVFAFNHEAAIRSFRRAAELDPDLAMAPWGIALALGPNINMPMDANAHKAAYAALQKAIALEPQASTKERAYIDALARRYSANAEDPQGPLQLAYKNAMRDLARRYPRDTDAAVLYAESLMDLHPWKLWAHDGKPAEGTLEIVRTLERAQAQQPDHIGALHYYIHAVEASKHPEKALGAAKRLEGLAPSAGHLVHMPAHIYIRTGNYLEAVRVNEAAARADEELAKSTEEGFYLIGYYGHNLHFLAVCNTLAGNSERAIAAANKLYAHSEARVKAVPPLDGFMLTPAMVLVQFGRWDDVLALPEPPFEAPITEVAWHFARTLAFTAKGQLADAEIERGRFVEAADSLPKTIEFGNNTSANVLAIARPYLDGRIALMRGDTKRSIESLREAAIAEDALAYDEPPAWYLPSRDALGAALLRAGDASEAEKAYRENLQRNPESGRSLFGLRLALAAQGRLREAAEVQKRFERAWRGADVALDASNL
jgi:tetratricopeptide (TPR) repeat protein